MAPTLGSVLLLSGLAVAFAAQAGIALHAFTGNPGKGLLCLFVPLYVYVYARRHKVGVWLMRGWYLGIALFIVGATLAS
ncbi:hypothetical protein [Variovorax sp. IB41]|jgi:hypothetical protein|uniref:hypothetical protein n=1 Tax=Variovorax sp. IB41 TaxID=2779370 RepID=UPI0018E880F0|nr:hypothetical protein [Variovorax sp. IB41]MBJ2158934.1 hypothetical protein [Variovorax sp. IB41]